MPVRVIAPPLLRLDPQVTATRRWSWPVQPPLTEREVLAGLLVVLRAYLGNDEVSVELVNADGGVTPLVATVRGDLPAGALLDAAGAPDTADGVLDTADGVLDTADEVLDTCAGRLGTPAEMLDTADEMPDLVVSVVGGELQMYADPGRVLPGAVERLHGHLAVALESITGAPETRVADVDVLTGVEREQILHEFNATTRPYPRESAIEGLFAEQVLATPDAPVVVHGDVVVTYRELDESAERLAAVLRAHGVVAGDLVALMASRTPAMVVGMLGVLKAGAGYLPIDPGYPRQRIDFLLADSGATTLITATGDVQPLRGRPSSRHGAHGTPTSQGGVRGTPTSQGGARGASASRERVAYLMYTSGTTGEPKGTLVSHRNVVRLVKGGDLAELSGSARLLATCAAVFDVATFEIWGVLLNGGVLHLADEETITDAGALGRLVAGGIDTMWLTSSLFNQLVEQDATIFRPLRTLLVGGEALSVRHVAAAMRDCPTLEVINGYGPTENTTFSTVHRVERECGRRVPIGRPIANSTAYVLDGDGRLLPIGVPGELYVGGDGVAIGYHNRPELTARAFVPDPFRPGGRLYRTGDRARWLPDGTLDFLGRLDDQVKIRGFRVEPGEVEGCLRHQAGVRDAAVVAATLPGGERYLRAYVTADRTLDTVRLRAGVASELPSHLVPAEIVQLDALPLNRSGKVDRSALPEPAHRGGPPARHAPADDTERRLVEIWREVLGDRWVGVRDDVFDLGVSSLTAARLAAGVQDSLGVDCTGATVLAARTIEGLARLVRAAGRPALPPIRRAGRRRLYPLTPQQRMVWAEQQMNEQATHYNNLLVVDLDATPDPARLQRALDELVARHDALRTQFAYDKGDTYATVLDRVHVPLERCDRTQEEFIRPFDLSRAPLVRAGLGRNRLLLDVHHAAADGLSLEIIASELDALYAGAPLPPVRLQYPDYAVWHAGEGGTAIRHRDEAYWRDEFAAPPPDAPLPTDFPRAALRELAGGVLEFEFTPAQAARLRVLGLRCKATLFQTLAAAYFVFLARITGQADLTVGTPVLGRPVPGLERVVGMFANSVCLRATVAPDATFERFVADVAARAVGALRHQDYPFPELAGSMTRDYSRNPVFDTMFAVQTEGLPGMTLLGGRPRVADEANRYSVFDLNLQIFELPGRLRASWGYSSALFTEATVRGFATELISIVDTVLADPRARIGDLLQRATSLNHTATAGRTS